MSKKFLSGINVTGTATLNTVANAGLDTDKFLVLDASGNIDYRTGAELKYDIGADRVSRVEHEVKLGESMSIGTPVYVPIGYNSSTNMVVMKASNASEATSSKTMGLIASSGITNDFVQVITEGLLSGLNTSTASQGDPVWLGVNGALIFGLSNKPVAPAHLVFLGIVTRVNSNNGEIFVKVQNGFEMGELHNYAEGSVADNQVIAYESATSLYKPKSIPTILGYTPADAARTLTINGVTYDLTANREWSIGASSSARTIQRFVVSTATQSVFTITNGYIVNLVDVYKGGVKLDNTTDFTATDGSTITLTEAAINGEVIEVYKYNTQITTTNAFSESTYFTATAGQTTFTISYNPGLIDVYYNGSRLKKSEYTATNGTSVVFATACVLNDEIEIVKYNTSIAGFTGIGGSGTTNYLPKFTASGTINNSLIYDNGTNVGIGTSSPNSKLEILPSANNKIQFGTGVVGSSGEYVGGLYYTSNKLSLQSFLVGTGYQPILIAPDGGNVGIGTSSPANYFSTTLTIDGSSSQGIMFRASGTDKGFIYQDGSFIQIGSNAGGVIFKSADTERMRITSGGVLAVGTTTDIGSTGETILAAGSGINTIVARRNGNSNTNASRILFQSYNASGTLQNTGIIEAGLENSTSNGYLAFSSNTTERMRITSGGNVGIGTNNPVGNLELGAATPALRFYNTNNSAQGAGYMLGSIVGANTYAYQNNLANEAAKISFHSGSPWYTGEIRFYTNGVDSTASTASLRMTISQGGNIGAPSGTNIYNASDARLKKNITTITEGLNKIIALNPVKFNWIDNYEPSEDGKDMLGFLAQEVQIVIPEAVESFSTGAAIHVDQLIVEDPLRVNEKFIIPVLVKAIQELSAKVTALENK